MSTPERRHFAPVAKVAILRKHLLEAQPVSEVCSPRPASPFPSSTSGRRPSSSKEPPPSRPPAPSPPPTTPKTKRSPPSKRSSNANTKSSPNSSRNTSSFKKTWGTLNGQWVDAKAGWKEAKIGIFAKRMRGESVATDRWADRKLPAPSARFAFARIAESTVFAAGWAPTAKRLGLDPRAGTIAVLGDGAGWI